MKLDLFNRNSLRNSGNLEPLVLSIILYVIQTVNTASGKLDKELRKHKYGALAVTCIRFSPKDHNVLFAATSEGNVHACNTVDTTVQDIVDGLYVWY